MTYHYRDTNRRRTTPRGLPVNEQQIRDTLRPHLDSGPISRLYATGEITEHTVPALQNLIANLACNDRDPQADQVGDVITYAIQVGARPAVTRWTKRAKEQQQ